MKTNYYQKIRDEFLEPAGLINKELTFGCWISWIRLRAPDDWEEIEYQYCGYNLEKWDEIIGNDYDIREVMIYLSRWNSRNFWLQSSWELFDDSFWTESVFQFDLSKPLKDQDLKGLYELMVEVSKS